MSPVLGLLAAVELGAALAAPTPGPSPTPAPGPCAQPALSSIAVRPGIGRAPATGGAVCVAPPGTVVAGFGYRSQATVGPASAQQLVVYPAPVVLAGVAADTELIVEPGLAFSRRTGNGFGLAPAAGQQDAGIGVQRTLSDRPWTQQAIEVFATAPTGYPGGPSGFSLSGPSYQASYAIAFSLSSLFGVTLVNAVTTLPGFAPDGSFQRYVAYQPSLTLSLAASPTTTVLLEDQQTTLMGPHGTPGNRALIGVQQTASLDVVLDLETEWNLLPPAGFRQHTTFEGGATIRL